METKDNMEPNQTPQEDNTAQQLELNTEAPQEAQATVEEFEQEMQTPNETQTVVAESETPEGAEYVLEDGALETDAKIKKSKPVRTRTQEFASWVLWISAAVIIGLLIRSFVFMFVQVDGPSMLDTLHTENRVFVWKAGYLFGQPQRGDIVICHYPENTYSGSANAYYVKRVIALPGDTLSIVKGDVYVNGEQIVEPYVSENRHKAENMEQITLGESEYFIMGDNRANSLDSRMVGPIERSQIVGEALYKVYPFDDVGTLEDAK